MRLWARDGWPGAPGASICEPQPGTQGLSGEGPRRGRVPGAPSRMRGQHTDAQDLCPRSCGRSWPLRGHLHVAAPQDSGLGLGPRRGLGPRGLAATVASSLGVKGQVPVCARRALARASSGGLNHSLAFSMSPRGGGRLWVVLASS